MKVRVTFTVYIDDDFRDAINHFYGDPGRASRDQVKKFFTQFGLDGELKLSDELYVMEKEDEEPPLIANEVGDQRFFPREDL